jgi:hypothetical protein
MSIRKNILLISLLVAVCVPTGLISSVPSQDSPRKKTVMGGNLDCPGRLPAKEIDLCKPIGAEMSSTAHQTLAQKEIELRKRDRTNIWSPEHKDVVLSVHNSDQIAWKCSDKSRAFQIVKIERILHKLDPDDLQGKALPSPPNGSPFCNTFNVSHVGRDPKMAQAPGTTLYSGPPVEGAIGHCYKYSYIVGNWDAGKNTFKGSVQEFDPHVIVTGPDPAGKYRPGHGDLQPNACTFGNRIAPRNPN